MPINITNVITRLGTYMGTLNIFLCSALIPLWVVFVVLLSVLDNERIQQTEVTSRKTANDVEIPDLSAIVSD